jgi:hypothetical protein
MNCCNGRSKCENFQGRPVRSFPLKTKLTLVIIPCYLFSIQDMEGKEISLWYGMKPEELTWCNYV